LELTATIREFERKLCEENSMLERRKVEVENLTQERKIFEQIAHQQMNRAEKETEELKRKNRKLEAEMAKLKKEVEELREVQEKDGMIDYRTLATEKQYLERIILDLQEKLNAAGT
jgi:chromosome segregation ATPase